MIEIIAAKKQKFRAKMLVTIKPTKPGEVTPQKGETYDVVTVREDYEEATNRQMSDFSKTADEAARREREWEGV